MSHRRSFLIVACLAMTIATAAGIWIRSNADIPQVSHAGTQRICSPLIADRNDPDKASNDPITVFIVHSYEDNNVCGVNQDKGVVAELKQAFGSRVQIIRHFMNTKTANRSPKARKAEGARVLARIRKAKPHIVFTIDDNAFAEVGLPMQDSGIPVVFAGMNGQPKTYNKRHQFLDSVGRPMANITGVYEKLQLVTSLRVLQTTLPGLHKVVTILDDSPTGKAIRVQIQRELAANDSGVDVELEVVSTTEQYLQLLRRIDADPSVGAAYNIVLSIRDAEGKAFAAPATFRTHLLNCHKPSMALNFAFARLGLFGGASVDFQAMGADAGRLGVRLLNGEDISRMPIVEASKIMITFNKARADMLGIEIPSEILASAQLFDEIPLLTTNQSKP